MQDNPIRGKTFGQTYEYRQQVVAGRDEDRIVSTEQMCEYMQKKYFYTVEIVFKTWNFEPSYIIQSSFSQNQNEASNANRMTGDIQPQYRKAIYLPEVLLIGCIHKIENFSIQDANGEEVQMMKAEFKTTFDGKLKYILLKKNDYKTVFVKNFNRMMKNKNEKHVFTSLKPILYGNSQSEWKLYFILDPSSYILHVNEQFYISRFKPLERVIEQQFKFSHLHLSKIISVDDLDHNYKDGFLLSVIKQKFQMREKQKNTLVGVINIIEKARFDKNSKTKKEIVLMVTQIMYRDESFQYENVRDVSQVNEIGRCKVVIRYSLSDEVYIQNLIVNNHVYAFVEPQLLISDKVNVLYAINVPKNSGRNLNIIRISDQPFDGINFGGGSGSNFSSNELETLFGINLNTIKVRSLFEKSINRNLLKLEIGLLQIEVICGSIRCNKCGISIKKNFDHQEVPETDEEIMRAQCRKYHSEADHALHLWGTIKGADDTGTCLVSMEHKQLIKYLELEEYYADLQKYVKEVATSPVIMSSNKEKGKLTVKEDPIILIKNRIRKHFVEKKIVGYAKTQLDKTFREGLSEEEQLIFMDSFHNPKRFLLNKKIFPNGIIKKKSEEILLIPFIKALEVIDD